MESKLLTVQTTFASFSNLNTDFQVAFSNNFLPILDNLGQLFLPFQSFEFIQILFCLLQFFDSSLWMVKGEYWVHTRFADILHRIAFFSSIDPTITENIILFSILFSIVLIITIILFILYINYKKTRRINKILLYIVRLYFMFIGCAILHPLASLTGHLFNISVEFHRVGDIIMLFFISIAFFLSEGLFYINQRFVNQSIYFHKSLFSTFDSTLLLFLFIWNPFFLLISHLFNYYPTWTLYILIIFHITIIIISLINNLWFSFTLELGNYFSVSILFSIILNDIFRIFVEIFDTKISQPLFFVICLIVLFICFIISIFIIKYNRNRINSILSYSSLPESNLTDEDKIQYFFDIKLHQNIKRAMIYLVVGFTNGSDMFIDFSLVQFCMSCYLDQPEMIVLLMHLLPYFKSEKTLFENVLKQFHLLRDSSLYGKFIYFQAHRVKIFRQVTSTNFESTQLDELKFMSGQLETQIKSFWSLETANQNTLFQMEENQRHLNNLWDESIEINWSSTAYREEHIKFLIESCTDFHRAVVMENVKEKIDSLSKERNDLCLLSLFLYFPHYINRKIFDTEGNLLKRKSGGSHSTSSTIGTQNDKNSSFSSEFDFTNDEQIANSLLTYGRMRLSMQHALNYAKPTMNKILILYTFISILFSLIVFISLFAVRLNSFDSLNDWNQKVSVLIELRFAYVRSFFCLTVLFGQTTNKFNIKPIDCSWTNEQNRLFIELNSSFDDLVIRYVNEAREQFSNLVITILELALDDFNISTLTSLLFDPTIQSNICYNDEIIKKVNWSMEQIMNFQIISFEVLANEEVEEISNWFTNNSYWCHDVTNFGSIENQFTLIQNNLAYDLSNSTYLNSKNLILQMKIISPIHFFLFIIPLPIILILYSREINHLIKIMLLTDQEYKEQAQKNVSLIIANENNSASVVSKSSFNWKFFFCFIFIFLSFFVFIIFETLILYFSMQLSNKVRDYQIWSCDYSLLRSFVVEILIELINSVYTVEIETKYLTTKTNKVKIYNVLRSFELFYHYIMNDSPNSPSSLEKDSFIDQIVLKAACERYDYIDDFHDTYKCASLNLLFSTFRSLIEKCIEELEFFEGQFQGEVLDNLYHIIFAHLITDLIKIGDRFISLQQEEINLYKKNLFIFFFCGIIFLLIYLFFMILIIVGYKRVFKMAICLIRRLPPVGLINNGELTNYLLFKKGEEVEIGVTHTIFNNSFDGIICLNVDGLVEIINKSFVNDYGYSTEQLVGQMIGSIFDDESRVKIENQLKLMKNHESNNYSEHLICITNDGRAVPSYITLFGIKGNENNLILVIRDETVLLQKKKRLELAKKRSQDLLEQIMPQKVLMMLKQGKSEISFVVPSASVLFVDIVGFSGFSADLSPQQIMGTLSALFGAFDIWIQKYPLMTKIKLIGDTYMAACGLFAVDEEPKKHAIQCVDFAIHVLSILDDINIKLNLNLSIRIGINSDGPIIAGVLGSENRVFDIIGDTINVASRLEHKAEPGHILISEKTYNLVKDNNYHIIPKGEIFLKGKGDMKAYSI